MKKILATITLLVACSVAALAQVDFGLRAGINLTGLHLSEDNPYVDKSQQYGFFAGPVVKVGFPLMPFSIDASVLYNQRVAKLYTTAVPGDAPSGSLNERNTLRHQTISIPVHFNYELAGIGEAANVFVFAGPQLNVNIGKSEVVYYAPDLKYNATDLSVNVGLGAHLLDKLMVTASYSFGVTHTVDGSFVAGRNFASREDAMQLAVAYFF